MDGASSFLIMFGLVFSLVWLSAYVFAFYALGRKLAQRYRLMLKPWPALAIFAIAAIIIDLPLVFLPLDFLFKGTLMFGLWLLHTQPTAIGYWAGYEIQRDEDINRWAENTDKWIEDFETQPAECMRSFDQE